MENTLRKTYMYNNLIDKKLSSFVVKYYTIEILNLFIKLIFPMTNSMRNIVSYVFIILLFLLMLSTLKYVLERSLLQFVITELLFLFLFIISLLQGNADSSLLFSMAFRTLGVSVPLAFYVFSIKNKEIFYNSMLKASYSMIFLLSLIVLINFFIGSNNGMYNMSLSYALVLPSLFQLNEFFKNKKFINFVFFTISLVTIIIYGARGPVICVTFMLICKFLLIKKNIILKFTVFILGASIISFFLIYSKQIGVWILNIFTRLGVYSRTIIMLANGTLFSNSGRDELFTYYIELIDKKPIFGWGLMGGWIKAGSGPHNMLIEFLLAFGYLGGGVLCILAVCMILRPYFVKHKVIQELLIIYCSVNIVLYLVSGNFLENVNMFIFIILCFTRQKRNIKNNNNEITNNQCI